MKRKHRFTDAFIRNLKAPAIGRREEFDELLKGFGVRVTPSGTKSWFVFYRVKMQKRLRRQTLGSASTMSLAEARAKAQESLRLAAQGHDPVEHERMRLQALAAAERAKVRHSVDAVITEYIEQHAKVNQRCWRATERTLRRGFAPPLSGCDIREITRADILGILRKLMTEKKRVAANRMLAHIRPFLAWCVNPNQGYLDSSPAVGIETPAREHPRKRTLNDEELKAVWLAAGELGYPWTQMVRLLIATAQRSREICTLKRGQLDFDSGLIDLPDNKANRPHAIPMSPLVRGMLEELPQFEGEDVLTTTGGKKGAWLGGKVKKRLDQLSGVRGWTIHDLRRTAASSMARLGVPVHVVERVLNHASGTFKGVTGTYIRYAYLREMAEALTAWAAHIETLTGGPQSNTAAAAERHELA